MIGSGRKTNIEIEETKNLPPRNDITTGGSGRNGRWVRKDYIEECARRNIPDCYKLETIAGIKRRPAMKRMIERWNATHEQKFVLLPKMYFTCNHSVKENTNEKCWQNIAILKIDGYDKFNLPSR